MTQPARADVHETTDCSSAAVQAAVDAADEGDEVFLNCASATWSSPVTIDKGITLRGNGRDDTIITADDSALLDVDVPGASFRLTALGLAGTLPQYSAAVTLDGSEAVVRVDHCGFIDLDDRSVIMGYHTVFQPAMTGLFDHNVFENRHGAPFMLWYGDDDSWNRPDDLGGDQALYLEDNTFTWTNGTTSVVCDGEHGARFVVRHNTITNGWLGWHDTGSTPQSRSTRAFELYANTFLCTELDCGWGAIGFRGGTGVTYDNVIPIYPDGWENPSSSEIYRVSYPEGGKPWTNACDDVVDRICSNFRSHCSEGDHRACSGDYDCPGMGSCVDACTADTDCAAGVTCLEKFDGHQDSFGWPCRDQTGRGQDDPVTHEQASSPLYWWGNRDPADNMLQVYIATVNEDYIKPDRDYFEETASFDGTSAVGVGPAASRPATCSQGVAYWATDEATLYVCQPNGSWAVHYRPYVYPHPLATGGEGGTGTGGGAGSGGTGQGGTAGSGGSGASAASPGTAATDDEGGCGCRVWGRGAGPAAPLMVCWLLGLLVMAAARLARPSRPS